MKPEDQSAFEAWALDNGFTKQCLAEKCAEGSPREGEYQNTALQNELEIWQAITAHRDAQASAINEQMLEALKEMVEVCDTKCRTDHHGYCQEHYLDDVNNGGCRVANAKKAITAAEAHKGA